MCEQWYYYEYARSASKNVDHHTGLMHLRTLVGKSKNILDLGCGEGTRLNTLLPSWKTGTGIDINAYAIKRAKKQYPRHHFRLYKGQTLPFEDASFDLVYSAFVLEHVSDPELFLKEAIRVLKKGGSLVIFCPNFGAPNRRSPCSTQNPFTKLLKGLFSDLFLKNQSIDSWTKVKPKPVFKNIDDDTTVEPYLRTLTNFIKSQGLKVNKSSSLWQLETQSYNPRKLLFKVLGRANIYPFRHWGPQVFLVAYLK